MAHDREKPDYAAEVVKASSLPEVYYRVGNEALESAARNTSEILRHYLAMDDSAQTIAVSPEGADSSKLRTETVPGDEMVALIQRLATEASMGTPDISAHVQHEHLWILADGAINGSCLGARMRAAEFLATSMDNLDLADISDKTWATLVDLLAPGLDQPSHWKATRI